MTASPRHIAPMEAIELRFAFCGPHGLSTLYFQLVQNSQEANTSATDSDNR